MIQLHYFPGNASFAPHLLLEELGTPFELQYVDRTVGMHKSPAYLKLNPNGLIPVLVDGALLEQMDAHLAAHGKDWFFGERYGAPGRAARVRNGAAGRALRLTSWPRLIRLPAGTSAPPASPA